MRTVLVFLLSFYCYTLTAQDNLQYTNYLKQNSASWNDGLSGIENVIDKELLKSQLILIGENHGVQYTHELQFDLLKYLKQKTNFRYLLVELGYLDKIYINRYLSTGNEAILDTFFKLHPATFFYNQSEARFYRQLYILNKNLPEKEKIRVLPLDLEFSYKEAIHFLQQQVFADVPNSMNILAGINLKEDSVMGVVDKFIAAGKIFQSRDKDFKKLLGPGYEDAVCLFRNIENYFECRLNHKPQVRDSIMSDNLEYYMKTFHIKNEHMLGLFSSFHVKQEDQPGDPKLAAIVRKKQLVRGIVSIVSVYNKGEIMMPVQSLSNETLVNGKMFVIKTNVNDGSLNQPVKDLEMLDNFMHSKAMLFRLDRNKSPFNNS
ncbi:MAG: hypothetical protein JWN76_2723, partial [Chitinophagaceae bacterium]|nr:hypothetical protein [Chitinophagaceae bacterium]